VEHRHGRRCPTGQEAPAQIWRTTYSPPVTLLVPKLLPTAPVQRHVLPAAFFQVAVAVAPTLRHVTERFERGGESMGEADVSAAAAVRSVRRVVFIVYDSV
jgi:hypothetical protein